MNYFFYMNATDININIRETEQHYEIICKSNYKDETQKKINKFMKLINCKKYEEIEEYYWNLTGDCDVANELSLIAMMADKVDVQIKDNAEMEVVIYRYKK